MATGKLRGRFASGAALPAAIAQGDAILIPLVRAAGRILFTDTGFAWAIVATWSYGGIATGGAWATVIWTCQAIFSCHRIADAVSAGVDAFAITGACAQSSACCRPLFIATRWGNITYALFA